MATTEELINELTKRGATMAQVALLKDPTAKTPDEAIELLQTGNSRFFSGQQSRVLSSVNSRRSQIMAQTPFAVVLGCADSRVPIELVFDQGPGDIFSIRVAGNVAEPATVGSIQYAIKHLKVKLVVVLGHEGCGAVAASLLTPEERSGEPLHVRFLLDAIAPALKDIAPIQDRKAKMREAVILNVKQQRENLEQDEVIAEAIANGQIKVVGAFYEIGSGAVDFLEG
ncbi:carbonic anhydrase [bacterium]|nr:MAG: carbonic anhydrase [bacterium]